MAIAFGTKTENNISNDVALTVGEPASSAQNDVLVGCVIVSANATSLARPSGWTNIVNGTTGGVFDWDVSYIVRGSGAAATNWTWTNVAGFATGIILRFTGCDTSAPLDAQSSTLSSSGVQGTTRAASDVDPPSVTVGVENAMAVALAVHWDGPGGGFNAPTNYTLRSTITNGLAAATRLLTVSGAEDPDEFYSSDTSSNNAIFAITLTLKEPGSAAPLTVTITEPVLGRSLFV
jgi:hypothetical protein